MARRLDHRGAHHHRGLGDRDYLAFQALVQGAFGNEAIDVHAYEWIPAGDFRIPFNLFLDNLTAVMLLVVTTIGMLVHVYSIGYMAHDPGRWRFFAYLNLFMFSMLLLVLAGELPAGVRGLGAGGPVELPAHRLLVPQAQRGPGQQEGVPGQPRRRRRLRAGHHGHLDHGRHPELHQVFTLLPEELLDGEIQQWMMIGICLLLFCGAMGKSAQFPLHVWLPDAMEGPTPVSALIHAATMVNAGVYLVARSSPLFAHAPEALILVAAVGIFTAIFAASIALTQNDIKRVLAYSTLSQLGYMFAALGVGAWTAAIFHLVTHGFFKGLLFLGSGSVIHGVHEEQDMNKMGGLRKKMPITHWTMLIGALAISGIPPLAGFFSKDEVLGEAFKLGFEWVWLIGVVVAAMTAFYMFRLMGKTFYGESHVDPAVEPKIHESPRSMTVPLILLAGLSIVAGAILGLPFGDSTISQWLEPVFHPADRDAWASNTTAYAIFGIDGVLILMSVAVADHRHGPRLAAVRLLPRPRRHLDQVRELTAARAPRSTSARSTSGTSTTSTTCCSCASAAWSRTARPGSTCTSSTAPSTASRA